MPAKKMSISVPEEAADCVAEKVQSGEYASESEVFLDGLRMLRARGLAIQRWLATEVAASYDDREKNGTRGVSADELLRRLSVGQRLTDAT